MSLCNAAGASLLAGGDSQQAAAELRRALGMERRIGNAVQEIELLLRLAAAEAAQGNTEMSAVLYSTWVTHSKDHGIELSKANERIRDAFLRSAKVNRSRGSRAQPWRGSRWQMRWRSHSGREPSLFRMSGRQPSVDWSGRSSVKPKWAPSTQIGWRRSVIVGGMGASPGSRSGQGTANGNARGRLLVEPTSSHKGSACGPSCMRRGAAPMLVPAATRR